LFIPAELHSFISAFNETLGMNGRNQLYRCSSGALRFTCMVQLFLFAYQPRVAAQTTYHNIGFESGSLLNWFGATGSCCPVYATVPGFIQGRHGVTTGSVPDPHLSGLVPMVAPGSVWSAKLGNDNGSAESEMLGVSIPVPSDSLLLVIRFALVFENALHPPAKQPRFSYRLSSTGTMPSGCTEETIICGDTSYPFHISGMVEVLPWQYRLTDLTGHAGDTIQIRFETGDCEPGGHFGYAYVDCDLVSSGIRATVCNMDGGITAFAPTGISGIWTGGQSGDSLVIAAPGSGTLIDFTPDNGCGIILYHDMKDEIPDVVVTSQVLCNQESAFGSGLDSSLAGYVSWNMGDGTHLTGVAAVHQYAQPGSYTVIMSATLPNNCIVSESLNAFIPQGPQALFSAMPVCPGYPAHISNNSILGNPTASPWNWLVDGTWVSSDQVPDLVMPHPGNFLVSLIVTDSYGCTDTTQEWIEAVAADSCNREFMMPWIPAAFTPNGDGLNDRFTPVFNQPPEYMHMTITDRYGRLIHEGRWWDGTGCPQGVYICTLRFENAGSVQHAIRSIQLVR
jgi:hypothetical protein